MQIPIPSNHSAFRLRMEIEAFMPFDLAIRVFDPNQINTWYISRRLPFKAELWKGKGEVKKTFSIPFPHSPKELVLEIFDRDTLEDTGFVITDVKVERMPSPKVWSHPKFHRFIDFAQTFSIQAGYLPTGFYESKNHEFLIEYLPEITDQFGMPLRTPARISRRTGRKQVSAAQFRSLTVPIRFFILAHEWSHLILKERAEKPPDRQSLKFFLGLGYPKTEAIYALTKIFLAQPGPVSKAAYERVVALGDYMDAQRENNHKNN